MLHKDWPFEVTINEFKVNLKLTEEEIEHLIEIVITQYEYCIKYNSKYNKNDKEKERFLLGLMIKLRNKYLELEKKGGK